MWSATGCIVLPGLESWLMVGLFCAISLFLEATGLLFFLRGSSKSLAILPLLTGIWCLALGGWTQAHAAYSVHIGCGLPPPSPPFIPTPELLSRLSALEGISFVLAAGVFFACLFTASFLRERYPRAAVP